MLLRSLFLFLLLVGARGVADPVIVSTNAVYDFGVEAPGATLTNRFSILNRGDATLELHTLRLCCGLDGYLTVTNVAPGGSSEAVVSVVLDKLEGPYERKVYLGSNDPSTRQLVLRFSGTLSKTGSGGAIAERPLRLQTHCPFQPKEIDLSLFHDYNGFRLYTCCEGCLLRVRDDPEGTIKTLAANGEKPHLQPKTGN